MDYEYANFFRLHAIGMKDLQTAWYKIVNIQHTIIRRRIIKYTVLNNIPYSRLL